MFHKTAKSIHQVIIKDDKKLQVSVTTPRIKISSLTNYDLEDTLALYGNPIVMQKFSEGKPFSKDKITKEFNDALFKWATHDPFTQYKVVENSSNSFIGIIAFTTTSPGVVSLSYLYNQKYWGQGYGKEAAQAMFKTLLPRLIIRGFKVDGHELEEVTATARLDNPASQNIIQSVGFKEEKVIEKYGAKRHYNTLTADDLKNNYYRFYSKLHNSKLQDEAKDQDDLVAAQCCVML